MFGPLLLVLDASDRAETGEELLVAAASLKDNVGSTLARQRSYKPRCGAALSGSAKAPPVGYVRLSSLFSVLSVQNDARSEPEW
jgi:hypothetical protein